MEQDKKKTKQNRSNGLALPCQGPVTQLHSWNSTLSRPQSRQKTYDRDVLRTDERIGKASRWEIILSPVAGNKSPPVQWLRAIDAHCHTASVGQVFGSSWLGGPGSETLMKLDQNTVQDPLEAHTGLWADLSDLWHC
jgi:hypothetical protein